MPKISELPTNSTVNPITAVVPLVNSGSTDKTTLYRARGGYVSILDYIPQSEHAGILARTSTYDCHDAIINAIESVRTGTAGGYYFSGPEVYFPPGRYRVLSTINITRQCKLIGTTGAVASNDGGSELSFPAGVEGIITNAFDTNGLVDSGSTTDPNTFSSAGSVIEGLRIIADTRTGLTPSSLNGFPYGHQVLLDNGYPEPGNLNAHAIRMRGMCLIRNCFIFGFEGSGIHAVAKDTPGGVGAGTGNVNLFRLEGLAIQRCAGHGVFVDGSDSNAGYGIGVNVVQNGMVGIYDSSFLGNTWIACHANTNYAEQYKTDNANACSLFLNCYSEIGGLPSSFSTATLVLGGSHGGGISATNLRMIQAAGAAGLRMYGGAEIASISLGLQGLGSGLDSPRTSGYSLRWQDTTTATGTNSYWQLSREAGRLRMQKGSVGEYISFYDSDATVANGYARNNSDGPSSGVAQIGLSTHFFGTKTQMRFRGLVSAAPTSGEYISGDVMWALTMTAGGKAGWVCTTSGTAGSTAVFKQFGAIDP